MEFKFTDKELAFRKEIEDFLEKELPSDWADTSLWWPGGYGSMEVTGEKMAVVANFRRKLAEKGWLTISWPEEYGGRAHSYMEQAIFDERLTYHKAPVMGVATGIAGPTILLHGTEENKREWVPRIAYSEPDAGSDLANMKTTALEDGDSYVINGQKIWSTAAHLVNYAWLVARTDPEGHRHRSVSLFVVDNNTPGVTIRPLINVVGVHSFNEVFFDNVRVPKKNMIGEKNMGFYYLMVALDYERLLVGIGGFKRTFENFVTWVNQAERDGAPLGRNPAVRRKLAEVGTRIEVAYTFFWRTATMLDRGQVPNVEASALKLMCTELSRNLADVAMEVLGPYGLIMRESSQAPFGGLVPRGYLDCISATIGAGTSEIQRNIIATRGLGLPRN
ncbi:acyl-CoA dehydrogenase family protein [Thermodesulfobacteriota bacterium]